MPSTGAVVKPLPSRTWGVSLGAFLPLTLLIEFIASAGSDKYGEKRYAIYIPKSVKEKAGKIAGKEVIVIVILPDDEE
jgi:hypothetical protein